MFGQNFVFYILNLIFTEMNNGKITNELGGNENEHIDGVIYFNSSIPFHLDPSIIF